MKDFIYKIRVFFVAVCSLAGISFFFINSETLCNMVVNSLHLKVDARFVGGEIAADFFDDSEDDSGSGILKYPSNAEFAEGCLDLLRYTVHQPVYDAKWQQNPDYWQIALEFKNGPVNVRNIMIYIGIQEDENPKIEKLTSSSETLFDAAENVELGAENPWNFAVWIGGKEGNVYDANGNFICSAQMGFENNGKSVKFRIPLKDKKLQRVYTAQETYHYVLVGAYSQFDRGGFMPIEKRRSNSRGGTTSAKTFNPLIPKLYDVLGDNQQLAEWNEDDLTKAKIIPFVADMKAVLNHNHNEDEIFINSVVAKLSEFENNEEDSSGQYFGFETLDEAFSYFENKMKGNPSSAIPMAYYGSCLAMKGGRSSVIQAVTYVNKAFEYLDKAVELCKNDDELVDVLMNRASVCKSVPESVFKKAHVGAEDFIKIASIQKSTMKDKGLLNDEHEKYMLAYFYISASQCYKTTGKDTESKILLQEAKKVLE